MLGELKSYVQDHIALAKLEGVEAVGRVAAKIVYILLMMIFGMFFLLLLSFAGAYYLGTIYGQPIGFLIITGVYLLLLILFLIFKKSLINIVVNIAIAASMGDKKD